MKKEYVDKNGTQIDLSILSFEELNQLNFKEEIYFAKKIKEKPAFSKERNEYMRHAYQKIFQIAEWKRLYDNNKGNGVTSQTVRLLQKIIYKEQKRKKQISFYEAGVGTAEAIKNLKSNNVEIKGCDIFLSEAAKEIQKRNTNIILTEESLYNSLDKIDDEAIDIFYADNVLEHIVADEYEETCKKIARKIREGGTAIFIIPNRYIGPKDVSRYFLSIGDKASGFHFMEQSFQEVIRIFQKYNLTLKYFCCRSIRKNIYYGIDVLHLNTLKIKAEKHLAKIKSKYIRTVLFKLFGYDIYILKKEYDK